MLVRSCKALKLVVERGASGTFRLLNNITCYERITIATDQTVRLESQQQALQAATNGSRGRVTIGRPFVGVSAGSDETTVTATTTTTTTTATSSNGGADGRGPDGHSLFVIEAGGSLTLAFIDFHRLPLRADAAVVGGGDGYVGGGSGGASSSSNGSRSSSISRTALERDFDGVRAVYSAGGNLTVEYCTFSFLSTETGSSSGNGRHDQVENGGVVRGRKETVAT